MSFNLKEEKYENLPTKPDSKNGYPDSRKCHAIVEFENSVYIMGGCRDIASDVNVIESSVFLKVIFIYYKELILSVLLWMTFGALIYQHLHGVN